MDLLAGADADDRVIALGSDRLRQIRDAIGRDLGYKQLPTPRVLKRVKHHLHPIRKGDIETGHVGIGDREHSACLLPQEERNHRTVGAHDIAVADDGELDVLVSSNVVRSDEQLVRGELGGTIEIDRGAGFVCGQRNDLGNSGTESGLDHIVRAADVRLDAFIRVVFCNVDVFHGGCVNHVVNAIESALKTIQVPDIADEITHRRVFGIRILLGHLVLLLLVARVDDQTLDVRPLGEDRFGEFLAERTGAAGD